MKMKMSPSMKLLKASKRDMGFLIHRLRSGLSAGLSALVSTRFLVLGLCQCACGFGYAFLGSVDDIGRSVLGWSRGDMAELMEKLGFYNLGGRLVVGAIISLINLLFGFSGKFGFATGSGLIGAGFLWNWHTAGHEAFPYSAFLISAGFGTLFATFPSAARLDFQGPQLGFVISTCMAIIGLVNHYLLVFSSEYAFNAKQFGRGTLAFQQWHLVGGIFCASAAVIFTGVAIWETWYGPDLSMKSAIKEYADSDDDDMKGEAYIGNPSVDHMAKRNTDFDSALSYDNIDSVGTQ